MYKRQENSIIPYVPSGVNFKLSSVNSIDPGHKHTRSSLSGIDIAGMETAITKIPSVTRLASNFDKTSDATMATVTGFTRNLVSGSSYMFKAYLWMEAGAIGGIQLGIAGTALFSDLAWHLRVVGDDNLIKTETIAANLSSTFTNTGRTTYFAEIWGTIVCTTSGTLTLQFAQAVSNGTVSRVAARSFFESTLL